MKRFIKKINLLLFLLIFLSFNTNTFGSNDKFVYTQKNISNYFLGIVNANWSNSIEAYSHLNKVRSLKKKHDNFNIQFIRTLVLLEKFEKAFAFSKDIWREDELIFETELLLGIQAFVNKDFVNAEKHFERMNKISNYEISFEQLFGNILMSWVQASNGDEKASFEFSSKIPTRFNSIRKIQNSFLQCYFDNSETRTSFEKLVNENEYDFSRYNFFLANYLIFKNDNLEAKKAISKARIKNDGNLLIKQTEDFIVNKKYKEIKKLFDCKNPKDVVAEFFYILANLHSAQENYKLSNFYLKISLFLNDRFVPNKTLLAENFYYEKKYGNSKKIYNSIKLIGPVYSWHASLTNAIILTKIKNKEDAIFALEQDFSLVINPDYQQYFELANFYKDNEYYLDSIKYYTLALQQIEQNHSLFPKILYRRGTSYERIGKWEESEKDLKQSLEILPDQPHVLNYLAYGWVEKNKNIDQSLEMLKKATQMRKNDGYIIDSLGWAYYAIKNYKEAEKYLQMAVEILPLDPVINDHYADTLWMLNKDIQARYFWKHVLNLDGTEQELKDKINKKIIFGINNKS